MADTHFREPLRFFHAGLCGPATDEAVTCLNLGFLEGFSTGTWVDQGQPMGPWVFSFWLWTQVVETW
jgi:hypothetical protein